MDIHIDYEALGQGHWGIGIWGKALEPPLVPHWRATCIIFCSQFPHSVYLKSMKHCALAST